MLDTVCSDWKPAELSEFLAAEVQNSANTPFEESIAWQVACRLAEAGFAILKVAQGCEAERLDGLIVLSEAVSIQVGTTHVAVWIDDSRGERSLGRQRSVAVIREQLLNHKSVLQTGLLPGNGYELKVSDHDVSKQKAISAPVVKADKIPDVAESFAGLTVKAGRWVLDGTKYVQLHRKRIKAAIRGERWEEYQRLTSAGIRALVAAGCEIEAAEAAMDCH